MALRSVLYSRPFKFVIVGECGSGKSTLIQKFLSGFSEKCDRDDADEDIACQPTFVCDGHNLTLKTTVKHVCQDGSSVAMTRADIARRLWLKKCSHSASRRPSITLTENDKRDIVWDEIFVYVEKPNRGLGGRPRLKSDPCSAASARSESFKRNDNEERTTTSLRTTEAESDGGSAKCAPKKPARKILYKRATAADMPNEIKCQGLVVPSGRERTRQFKSNIAEVEVDIWDIGGDKSLMWYRWYACTGADAVLLCVPLSSILKFDNMQDDYSNSENDQDEVELAKNLRKFMSDEFLCSRTKKLNYRVPPVLLVGTKSDHCESRLSRCSVFDDTDVEDSIGLKLAREIGCCDFVRCSGLKGWGVTAVFETALAVSLTSVGRYRASTEEGIMESSTSESDSFMAKEVAEPTYFKVHSFQKESRPPIIIVSENEDGSTGDERDAVQSSVTCPITSTPKQPPQLFFPPPPESSPPSTRPPSSNSSLGHSVTSSSLESIGEIVDDNRTHDTQAAISTANTEDSRAQTSGNEQSDPFANNERITNDVIINAPIHNGNGTELKLPTPAPRRRKKENTSKRNTSLTEGINLNHENSRVGEIESQITPPPVVMRPRRHSPSPRTRKRMSQCQRRESVFIKFLQS